MEEEKFDVNNPEDVLIQVIYDPECSAYGNSTWDKHFIETATIINTHQPGSFGVASYELSYGCGLEYMIEDLIDCPGPGWWVVESITGHYTKGDGWMTDDNMDFYGGDVVRHATSEEIDCA